MNDPTKRKAKSSKPQAQFAILQQGDCYNWQSDSILDIQQGEPCFFHIFSSNFNLAGLQLRELKGMLHFRAEK